MVAVEVEAQTNKIPFGGAIETGKTVKSNQIEPIPTDVNRKLRLDEIEVKEAPNLYMTIDQAVAECKKAQESYKQMPLNVRKKIIAGIRARALLFAHDFALCAWSETGRGRYEDKLVKQKLAINSTPGLEDLQSRSFTGENGLTIIDYAPYGVLGAVTPVTNPTATVINNSITVLAGGNGLVFNPHPGATKCTNRAIAVLQQAICEAGGPQNLLTSVREPTIESGQRMMTHPDVAANLITGGPAVVKVAMKSGKKSFCAGPGNPPVVVDETANLDRAAKRIYNGASFDNNMICSDEKQVFVVESVADKLIEEFRANGAYIASEQEQKKLTSILMAEPCADYHHGVINKDLVGMNADVILAKIGVTVSTSCRLVIVEVSEGHPLVWTEQLLPVLPLVRVKDFEAAVSLALRSEYNFRHTASLYSGDIDRITMMARKINTSLFIVNGAHTAGLACGGEGYTSFSIAGTTGEGMTRPSTFVRERRMVCVDALRYV